MGKRYVRVLARRSCRWMYVEEVCEKCRRCCMYVSKRMSKYEE